MTMIYAQRASGREHGSVATREEVVDFMLDRCGYTGSNNLSKTTLLDPSAGDGAFIIAALQRLFDSSRRFEFDFRRAASNLMAVEIDGTKSQRLEEEIVRCVKKMGVDGFEPGRLVTNCDFLTGDVPAFDIVVGNPPYVRHENIPEDKKSAYRIRFKCFRHRSDIYVAFFEKALGCLSKAGRLCFVCPDRWLKNMYGGNLRDYVSEGFGVPLVVDLNEVSAFKENVDSYPMVIMANADTGLENIEWFKIHDIACLKHALPGTRARKRCPRCAYKKIRKPRTGEVWSFGNRTVRVPNTFTGIEHQGFKVSIGVATGADSVFIRKDWAGVAESDLLLPIVLSKDIVGGEIKWSKNYVLNPFGKDGRLVNLDEYPLAGKYLQDNKERLGGRHVAKKRPENWYRTIDAVHHGLVQRPKLLLPDLKKDNAIAMDHGKYYPHHNLYYITGGSVEDLKVLGAVLLSETLLEQLDSVGVHMRGGYTRWQAQSVRRLLIPHIQSVPDTIRHELASSFEKRDRHAINLVLGRYLKRLSRIHP